MQTVRSHTMKKANEKEVNLIKKIIKEESHMYIAIDFDGIIHEMDYDNYVDYKHFNKPIKDASKYMHKLKEEGWKIIIWTCRKKTVELLAWLAVNDIPCHSINENVAKELPGQSDKVYADIYVDDKNLEMIGEKADWAKIYKTVRTKFGKYYKNGTIKRNGIS